MRGIVSVTLFPIIFYGLGAGGRNGFRRLLISEPVFLEVCMPRVRERQHVGRSVSRLWLFNFQLAGGGEWGFRRLFALRGGAFGINSSGPGGRAQGRWGVGEGCRRIMLSDVALLVCIPAGRKESVGVL